MRRTSYWLTVAIALTGGCYEGVSVPADDLAGPGDGAAESGAGDDDSSPDGDTPGDDDTPEASCVDGVGPVGATPLRRLSVDEYNATVEALLGDDSDPAHDFVADEVRGGFPNNATAADALQIDQYRAAAADLAETAAAERFDAWIECDRDDEECARSFIADFGGRAFRRPLEAVEIEEYVDLYLELRSGSDGTVGLQHVVETMLMSPNFLYHVELGRTDEVGSVVRLTSWEVASRLSYFLWGTMPDSSLMDLAAADALADADAIEVQVERMLDDPRAEAGIARFGKHWLELGHLDEVERDPVLFPQWNPELLDAMADEANAFIVDTWLGGDLRALFTGTDAYVESPALAELYGIDAADGALDPEERSGILTLGAFLTSHAYPTENSWVHRGLFVRTRLLCGEMPPPPADLEFPDEINDPNRMTNPDCAGCHTLIDPIGQAFDAYDPTGRFVGPHRSGEVAASTVGAFESIPELGRKMVDDGQAQACLVDQVGQFALGRALEEFDPCSREAILERFAESGHDLRALMGAIATSQAFVMLNRGNE
jgi:hypothetical protein